MQDVIKDLIKMHVTSSKSDPNALKPPAILKPLQHPFPFDKTFPQKANTSLLHPSTHRFMSSRTLGEDIENIRESSGAVDIDGDFIASLKGKKCDENTEMLQISVVAVAMSSQSSEAIMDAILAQGVNNLSIKPMGGMLHLITFVSSKDKQAMIEGKWLDQWFLTIQDVNSQSSSLWRETRLNIYGIPLVAWSYKNFYNIGCIFGRVSSETTKILIVLMCLLSQTIYSK